MRIDESNEENEIWSDLRQAYLTAFEARLYRERADLSPAEAVKWWERYVLSSEAGKAIAAGRTIEEEVSRRASTEPARAEERRADERVRRAARAKDEAERSRSESEERARQREERDRLAVDRDFLADLSPKTAALVSRVTKVGLNADTDYPCQIQVEEASDGRMNCTRYHQDEDGYLTAKRTEFDAAFGEVLQFALEYAVSMIDLDGLAAEEVAELLSSPEYWANTAILLDQIGGEPLYLNGLAYKATNEGLVYDTSED